MQLNTSLQFVQDKSEAIFTTGGGAFNRYLQQRIEAQTNRKVVVPSAEIVNYKEALIIAFMGVLRWRNEINVLQTVTGAKADSVNGAIYY
jgi:anhydro-N-acetylmuramic acid kinase